MLLAVACDHAGYELKNKLIKYLTEEGHDCRDFGSFSDESCDYPVFADQVCTAVLSGEIKYGILICGTGIGMAITANKIPGIRAALCSDSFSAEMSRRHNDANVLALGARVIGSGIAIKIVELFLNTGFDGGRHSRRVDMMNALDKR